MRAPVVQDDMHLACCMSQNYYAPRNKDCVYPAGVKPPLLVKIHGGPTAQAGTELRLTLQYWTSRGAPRRRHTAGRAAIPARALPSSPGPAALRLGRHTYATAR